MIRLRSYSFSSVLLCLALTTPVCAKNSIMVNNNIQQSQFSNSSSYKIAAMQFLPDIEDSELGFGSRNLSGNYNKGEQTTKGCSEGSPNRCANGQIVTRSYRAPNGTTCYVCEKSSAQKCLDQGFRKQEDWPKPTTIGWNTPLKQDNVFFAFFNNLLGIKNANALLVLEKGEDPILADIPLRPIDGPVFVNPDKPLVVDGPIFERPTDDGTWEFQVSSTCDEDQSYVKGEWKWIPKPCDVVNCAACKTGTSYTCSLCKPGYKLSSGMCNVITVENCIRYDSSRACTACASGYLLFGGACVIPTPNCEGYFYDGSCARCKTGYYLNGKSCYACIAPGNYGNIGNCPSKDTVYVSCNAVSYCSSGNTYKDPSYCNYITQGLGGFRPAKRCPSPYVYNSTNCKGSLGGLQCGANWSTCSSRRTECPA